MTFDSLTFVVFLLGLLGLYHVPGMSWQVRKWLLLLASWIFYGAWNPPFLLLLVGSATLDWWLAQRMDAALGRARRVWLWASLISNLGVLAFFKYGDFLRDNAQWLLAQIGIDWQPAEFDILLPVGISFYTFQSLSYCIDVYRREVVAQRSWRDYQLFVGFFPQLVAGPIVRYHDFAPQLETPRRAGANAWVVGISLLLLGLMEKILLADSVFAPVADAVFAAAAKPDPAMAWAGALAFAGQIFCDFAGYSTAAIGTAALFGFWLPDNFRSPYAATGFSDFWRRWHISLSSWLRDYLYIPLGGNRGGRLFTLRNLLLTMLLGGLWHGAAWTFVAWGGFHGLMLALERLAQPLITRISALLGGVGRLIGGLLTLLAVVLAWVWFRATDFSQAAHLHQQMLWPEAGELGLSVEAKLAILVFALLWLAHWLSRNLALRQWLQARSALSLGLIWSLLIILIVWSPGTSRAFIYFQF
jgi:alginate O-acetyltransferase complex protein AlgI